MPVKSSAPRRKPVLATVFKRYPTRLVDGRRRLVSNPPLLVPIDELVGADLAEAYHRQMGELIDAYMHSLPDDHHALVRRYRYAGLARKVVGVGSVGTPRLDRAAAGP